MNICLGCEGVTTAQAARCGHCGAPLLPLDSVHYPERRGEADAGNPLLGAVVDGKYRLQGVLGRGGLGTVFLAEHTGSLMRVAVKLLHPRFSQRAEYRRALLPEARRAATVTNEHCARLLDVGESADGGTYLAMEMVDGETLDALVRRGALSPSHAVDVLLQIADALVAIHGAGLVHCDLSPRNVMVTQKGERLVAKVLDFGIARPVSVAAAERVGAEPTGFANPAFSAPEQLAGGDVDPRADLYSLGAIGWCLLTGEAPTGDLEGREAARATVAGELRPWPNVSGVPRRLLRLLRDCLRLLPEQRPPSAVVVLHELRAIRRVRTGVARVAVALFALAVVAAAFAWSEQTPMFLDAVANSPLTLAAGPPDVVRPLRSAQLDTVQFHYGGFDARRLHVDMSRRGTLLHHVALQPEVDPGTGLLTLAQLQPEWRSVVNGLVAACREDAVDLSFGAPGRPPLGFARVRIDDEAPAVEVALTAGPADALVATTSFRWRVADTVGLARAECVVEFADRRSVVLPLQGGEGVLALGEALAQELRSPPTLPRATVRVVAADAAGNAAHAELGPFETCDVAAPQVRAAGGPLGERFVPVVAGAARLHVQLSDREPGAELVVRDAEGRVLGRERLGDAATVDVTCTAADGQALASGRFRFEIVDAAGNRTSNDLPVTLRAREVRAAFAEAEAGCAVLGRELVLARTGGAVVLHCAESFRLVRVTAAPAALVGALVPDAVAWRELGPGATRLQFSALPTGGHRLELEFEARDEPEAPIVRDVVSLRVLPDQVEVRVGRAPARFLPALTAGGVLQRTTNGFYRDGVRPWIEPELLPYVRGRVWVGSGDELVSLAVPAKDGDGLLLPEFRPLQGRNVLALALRDALDRPVRVLVGDAAAPVRECDGQNASIVADFWWHDRPPEPVGEELLVERGQSLRVRLRLPLPYTADDLGGFELGIGQGPVPPRAIAPDGDGAIVTFDVGFPTWSVAAQLADSPREVYAEQQKRIVPVYVKTPMGRSELELALRTARSTLRTLRLGDVAPLPPALADLRLVPVLGPDAAFAEPAPVSAPPRALYRSQVPTSVRNIEDLLLQDREMTWGQLRALLAAALPHAAEVPLATLVHAWDPLGARRLEQKNLLPPGGDAAPDGAAVTGIDYFQARTACRLLGLLCGRDPDLFRLPMGVELEVAAFGGVAPSAANGPAARGRPVRMRDFLGMAMPYRSDAAWQCGDVVESASHADLGGLDFGVREWVGDLPTVPGAELLLKEWIGDHSAHLQRVLDYAAGRTEPPADLADAFRGQGVVRGLALGETDGLLDGQGHLLPAAAEGVVPASVPGVLRTEQLRRDGRSLLSSEPDPRLRHIGFRVAGRPARVALLQGGR